MYQPKTIGDLPDIAKSLQKLKIVIDLRNKADYNSLVGMAFIQAVDNKRPADEIIEMVKMQAKEDHDAVISAIGYELTEIILNF